MDWPDNKKFAFTIIDDTDKATIENIKPIYDFLYEKGIITTKTVWTHPSDDEFKADTLVDDAYRAFIKEIADKGFEIGFHGAGSGDFNRDDILSSFNMIKELVGYYPKVHMNHAFNKNNIYWNDKRFTYPIGLLYRGGKKLLKMESAVTQGEMEDSPFFWGDIAKENVMYIRNRVFTGLDTLSYDKYMPYKEKNKEKYSNYWFSSSDGIDCHTALKLLSKKNIDKLEKGGGCAVVYVHFAYGFVNGEGKLNELFKERINYLSEKNGWFVPAGELLDFLKDKREDDVYLNALSAFALDARWMAERIIRKVFWGV